MEVRLSDNCDLLVLMQTAASPNSPKSAVVHCINYNTKAIMDCKCMSVKYTDQIIYAKYSSKIHLKYS